LPRSVTSAPGWSGPGPTWNASAAAWASSGGPGETQIEADRRAIDEAITRLRRQLAKVVKTRSLHRAARAKVPYPVVALVGYTNAGKSTLFNRLTGAEVMAKDMLFATLDPTMRAVTLPDGTEVILSDTVGFISDLPTQLVAAFRATLEEVLDADLICHVRDISHPQTESRPRMWPASSKGSAWRRRSRSLRSGTRSTFCPRRSLRRARRKRRRRDTVHAISAITGEGLEPFLAAIAEHVSEPRHVTTLTLPHADGRRRAWLFERGIVEAEDSGGEDTRITVRWTDREAQAFRALGDVEGQATRSSRSARRPAARNLPARSGPSRSSSTSAPSTMATGGIRSVTSIAFPDPAAATTR
jgi:GTP-binding protein HflX